MLDLELAFIMWIRIGAIRAYVRHEIDYETAQGVNDQLMPRIMQLCREIRRARFIEFLTGDEQ